MKSKSLLVVVILGALIVGRMTMVYAGQDWIGFAVTLAIAFGFAAGIIEVSRRQQLLKGLSDEGQKLNDTLLSGESTEAPRTGIVGRYLQARLLGTQGHLPQLILTPYLMGLMVMLGLLGTFLGLVETLEGARSALAVNTELSAVRMGLTQPIQGLSRAFGTSVAGVATSALLGYLLSQYNRERQELRNKLDQLIVGPLNHLTLAGRQTASMEALAQRLDTLPAVSTHIETLCLELRQLGSNLALQHQEGLHANAQILREGTEALGSAAAATTQATHDTLAAVSESMERSIRNTSDESAKLMRESIDAALDKAAEKAQPMVESVLTRVRLEADDHFQLWNQTLQENETKRNQALLENLDERSVALVSQTETTLSAAADHAQRALSAAVDNTEAALTVRAQAFTTTVASLEGQMTHLVNNVSKELADLSESQQSHQQTMTREMGDLDQLLTHHLESLGHALSEPLAQVMDSVAEAPRAARDVIEELREERAELLTRDNELLAQREALLSRLNQASTALESSMTDHHILVENLVEKANSELEQASNRNFDKLEQSRAKLEESAAMVATGGVEMAAVATMFSTAVEAYTETSDKLLGGLERIEEALSDSGERSNQQLSLYVDQAREIIDQSLLSQKEIFEALRSMQTKRVEPEVVS